MLTGVDYVIVVGGFSDRGEVLGTFADHDDALDYAQRYINEHWEIVPLHRPFDASMN